VILFHGRKRKVVKLYRISDKEVQEVQAEYKKNYLPFRPFSISSSVASRIFSAFANLISTQNGQDTDDYCIEDNNKVERYLKDAPAGSRVLFLGVGTGRETVVAKELGLAAVGVTLGSRNVDFGVNHLGLSEEEHIECLNEALPFASCTFDVVAGFQVFEHTLAPLLFLLEQSRVLKFGGQLILEWPPANNYSMGSNPHHQVCFTPGQAYALFQKAGFSDISVFYDDFSPIPDNLWWGGEHDRMLCIKGTKQETGESYIRRAWSVK